MSCRNENNDFEWQAATTRRKKRANAINWKSNSRHSSGNRQPHSIVQKFMVGLHAEDMVETAMTERCGDLNHYVIISPFSPDTYFTKSFSIISGLEEKLRELLIVLMRNRYPSVFSIHHGLMITLIHQVQLTTLFFYKKLECPHSLKSFLDFDHFSA